MIRWFCASNEPICSGEISRNRPDFRNSVCWSGAGQGNQRRAAEGLDWSKKCEDSVLCVHGNYDRRCKILKKETDNHL